MGRTLRVAPMACAAAIIVAPLLGACSTTDEWEGELTNRGFSNVLEESNEYGTVILNGSLQDSDCRFRVVWTSDTGYELSVKDTSGRELVLVTDVTAAKVRHEKQLDYCNQARQQPQPSH